MEKKGLKRYSLSQQVSDKLEAMIEEGKYAIGEKIPTEVELMELFSVSRNTIREAVQSLTQAGVLDVKQGDGTYVRQINRFNGCMSMKYEQVCEKDIKETRNALELTIAYLAAKRRTEEDMKNITDAFISRKSSVNTAKENTIADVEFHMAIANACHNGILIDLYKSISSFVKTHILARQAETDVDEEKIDALHEDLYNAIRDQDKIKARVSVENILKI